MSRWSAANCGRDGLLIVGHGTRDATGRRDFLATVEDVRARLADLPVAGGFLELADPSIAAAVAQLVQQDVRRLRVLPFLLFAARHVKFDIPQAVDDALRAEMSVRRPVTVEYLSHLGDHPAIVDLSVLRYDEVLAQESFGSGNRVREPVSRQADNGAEQAPMAWVMVARGTGDPETLREVEAFARVRAQCRPVCQWQLGYLAIARPTVDEALEGVARGMARRVVVQPHLLFSGQLWEDLAARVDQAARRWPHCQWQLTRPLGPHPRLVDWIASLARAAGHRYCPGRG